MSKKYDVAGKTALNADPAFLLQLAGIPVSGPITELNSDLSSVTREADCVYRIEEANPWLAHFEILADPDPDIPEREDCYNALVGQKYKVNVLSAVVLLAPKADHEVLTGIRHCKLPNGFVSRVFQYIVIRLWEIPSSHFLSGPAELLPYAVLSKFDEREFPSLLNDMQERLDRELPHSVSQRMMTTARLLMGLRFSKEFIQAMFIPLDKLKSSVTYQEILERGEAIGEARGLKKGKAEGELAGRITSAREILVHTGTKKWGKPSRRVLTRLKSVSDLDLMTHLAESVLDLADWDQLLAQIPD